MNNLNSMTSAINAIEVKSLYNRMIEERVKASIIGYGNSLGV